MKKILFATTALVAFAGAASAEVSLSGSAEMGLAGGDRWGDLNDDGATTTNEMLGTNFWQDMDIRFTMSGESDYDLTFGAVVDLDESGNLSNSYDDGGTSVYVRGQFGSLTLGDTDGALDWAMTEVDGIGNPGSIADDETAHTGDDLGFFHSANSYLDGAFDGQILRYDNTFGDFGVAISIEQGTENAGMLGDAAVSDGTWAVGVKYTLGTGAGDINLGAGFQSVDLGVLSWDATGLSAGGSFGGGFSAGVAYTMYDFAGLEYTHFGVGVGFENGPVSVHANYGQFDYDLVPAFDSSGFGLAAAYDLGGGLSANVGYGSSDPFGGLPSISTWSAGFSMSF